MHLLRTPSLRVSAEYVDTNCKRMFVDLLREAGDGSERRSLLLNNGGGSRFYPQTRSSYSRNVPFLGLLSALVLPSGWAKLTPHSPLRYLQNLAIKPVNVQYYPIVGISIAKNFAK